MVAPAFVSQSPFAIPSRSLSASALAAPYSGWTRFCSSDSGLGVPVERGLPGHRRGAVVERAQLREDVVEDDLVALAHHALELVDAGAQDLLRRPRQRRDLVRPGGDDRGGQRPPGLVALGRRRLVEPAVEGTTHLRVRVLAVAPVAEVELVGGVPGVDVGLAIAGVPVAVRQLRSVAEVRLGPPLGAREHLRHGAVAGRALEGEDAGLRRERRGRGRGDGRRDLGGRLSRDRLVLHGSERRRTGRGAQGKAG